MYVDSGTAAADRAFGDLAARFWHPVARSVDVPTGVVSAARLLGRDLAVFRAADGSVAVVDDLCAHRGARLSVGEVDGGCVRRPRPTWPVADAGTHWLHVGTVYDWNAQAFRQIENFCDVAHFSVLHVDTFGNDEQLTVDAIQVETSDDGYRLAFDYEYPSRDPTATVANGEKAPVVGTRFEYRLELPFTVALGGASGPGTVMCVAASPTSATTLRLFWLCAFPVGVEIDGDAYEALEARIWLPDRAIVEGQRPERLPVDLLEELHLPFDRLAIAYRRAVRAIGFGTDVTSGARG